MITSRRRWRFLLDRLRQVFAICKTFSYVKLAIKEELESRERQAEEECDAHNATKMAAMERKVELEHRAIDASTALVKMQGLIMLANVVTSIVQLLRVGTMETRENAAATLFSLSLANENKFIIGASGAIPALVNLLENRSTKGKKDATTTLFNLCIYQGNKGPAVRAGVIVVLLKMLTDSSSCMVDDSLPILYVLASHQEAKPFQEIRKS
ncbi:U-box domain-containing protein 11-like protein [Tanacetum coccineum]